MGELERFQQLVDSVWEMVFGTKRRKPKRARTAKGRYKGDNKSTKEYNEAWIGGKSPKRRKNAK